MIFCLRIAGGPALRLTRVGNGTSAAEPVEDVRDASLFGREAWARAAASNLVGWARREGVVLSVARVTSEEEGGNEDGA